MAPVCPCARGASQKRDTPLFDGVRRQPMTQTTSSSIEDLRTAMNGPVIGPGDPDYDDARTVWNAEIDRRPTMIARCLGAADVSAAIVFATEHALEIAVRGGAHSISGASVVDD